MNKEELMQQLKSALRSNDPKFDDTARARTLAALAALISMFLPWVWLDGDNSALNGAELLAYAFTSPERRAMIQTSLLGSLGILFIPLTVAVLAVYGFLKTSAGEYPLTTYAAAAALPVLMLVMARSVTSSDQPAIAGVTLPEWGVVLMVGCQAGLFIHGLLNER